MRSYIFIFLLIFSCQGYCQVGINTRTPKGLFHIDAGANTDLSGIYTDDIIINSTGCVSIGANTIPSSRIDITAPSLKGLILQDGTQKNKSILHSDAQGGASWKPYETSSKKFISNASPGYKFQSKSIAGVSPTIIPFPKMEIDLDGNYIIILRFFGWRGLSPGTTTYKKYDAGYFEFRVNGTLKDQPEHYLTINDRDYFSFDIPFFFNSAKKGDIITLKLWPSHSFDWFIVPSATNNVYKPSIILIKI